MSHAVHSTRRQFVRTFTFGTAFSLLMGKPWRGTVLAEVQALAGLGVGTLRVKLSDYPALLEDFGSVRLGFSPFDEFTGLPSGLYYPILINRAPANRFYAMDSYCQHQGCVVPVYDAVDAAMICPCHGSTYAIDGAKISGPASGPLIRYPIIFDGVNTLSVQVPGLGYSVTTSQVNAVEPARLRLNFPTLAAVEYEVLFRARVRDEWAVAPFTQTVDAPADQISLIGDDQPATIFVDRPTQAGFFSVAIKILDQTTV